MNTSILKFLEKQTCATICCTDEKANPYCFSCYYVFDSENGLMYFKSSAETEHAQLLQKNRVISGTVLPDTLNKLIAKGVQLQGVVLSPDEIMTAGASAVYHKKMPLAVAVKGTVFTIRIDRIKMTDSSRIFGKKINWERETGEYVIPSLIKN